MLTPSSRSQRRQLLEVDLDDETLGCVTYVGSAEHKDYPSSAGPPRLRADAMKCDATLHERESFATLTRQLRDAMRAGRVGGPMEGAFPRYVWVSIDERWFEARLVNRESGDYKGYEVHRDELPRGVL
jgi:hypothetical protein